MRKILFIFAAVLLGSIGLHAENTITYTAPAILRGKNFDLGAGAFGPSIIKHEFDIYWRVGTITCSGEITQIGYAAFKGCSSLTSITIPNSVTMIDKYAFEECRGLTSVTIGNSVTYIDYNAFCNTGLTSIEIPNSVTHIGSAAFANCSDLKSVTISNSVTTIEEQTFYHCNSLTTVNIPNSVTTIQDRAFQACNSLTSIEIPNSVTQIKWGTFMECSNLQSVYCYALTPPSRVGGTIFTNQPTVYTFNTEAYIESWSELPASCFKPIPAEVDGIKYEFSVSDGYTARVVGKDGGYTGNITIPEQVAYQGMTFTVTEIADGAFTHSGITSITLPPSITKIGMGAFEYCGQLQSITLPSSVSIIGDGAFQFTGLTSITIPASVERIGHWAFQECPNLKEVIIPSSSHLTSIGEKAFYNIGLTSVTIPAWVEKIENDAFLGCPLEYVVSMSETPPTLGDRSVFPNDKNAFVFVPTPEAVLAYKDSKWGEYFTKIYSNITYNKTSSSTVEVVNAVPVGGKITIPSTVFSEDSYYKVTGIADSAFYGQDTLVSISLPSSIQYIGNNAFNGCTNLKDFNINLMESLQTIGEKAFYGCTALESIVIPEEIQSIGNGAFMECTGLTSVTLPTGLKIIPNDCFRHCYNLRDELIIPEGVDTIGVYSFNTDTSLKKVSLPSSLKELRYGAFAGTALLEVTCLAPTPPTLMGATFGTKGSAFLYVYVPNRDVLSIYEDSQWGSNTYAGCNVIFKDLMSEENKAYLYEVAGNNVMAKAIAQAYCDSIDNYANNSNDVQLYTNRALGRIDSLTINDYKDRLVDSLKTQAKGNPKAEQIAAQYEPRIKSAYFRMDAEQLYKEASAKIEEIIKLNNTKQSCIDELKKHADNDEDLLKVAEDYGKLISRAETKKEVEDLYKKGYDRISANKSIKKSWTGGTVTVNNLQCSTTNGYINH